MSSRSGESVSSSSASPVSRTSRDGAGPRPFPPQVRAEVIAMACALPAERGVPLARWSAAELAREAVARGICEQISGVTVWRWLSQDAIRPWQHRSWIFPRDPRFAERAGPDPRPLPRPLAGRAAAPRRLRHLRRREALDPSPHADRSDSPRTPARRAEGRARVRAPRRALLPRRLGHPPRQDLRPLRPQRRDRAVRRARRPVHVPAPLHERTARLPGSSTTAPPTAANAASTASKAPGRT